MNTPSSDQRDPAPLSGDQTRAALVHAALRLFGSQGFEATSTREIARMAEANIGSIAYHFGNKEGLRLAAAEAIVAAIGGVAGEALGPARPAASREAAREQLLDALGHMVRFVVTQPEAGEIVQFLLRELAHPTAALDRIYTGVFEPTHRRLCALWETATGEAAESEATRLTVFTLVGQIVYFRIAQEAVKRRMGWPAIGADEAAAVTAAARRNLLAIFAARDAANGDAP